MRFRCTAKAYVPVMASPRFHSVRSSQGLVASADQLATQAGLRALRPRRQRRRRGASPPTRPSPSPRRTCAAWAATCSRSCTASGEVLRAQLERPGRLGRRRRGAARRRSHRDAVPPRHPQRHRARVRRRLDGAARAVRHAAPVATARAGDRSGRPTASRPVPLLVGAAARADEGASENLAELLTPAHPSRRPGAPPRRRPCARRPSPQVGEPRSTKASSATGCRALGAGLLHRRRPRADRCPNGSRR